MAMARLIVGYGRTETWDLAGEESQVQEQYEKLKEALLMVDGTGPKFFELTGMSHHVSRKPETFIVRLEDVQAVAIQDL